MRQILSLIFGIGLLLNVFAQERPFFFKVDAPEYVPQNNSFEVSVFSRITDRNCVSVKFYLLVDTYVELRAVSYIDDIIEKQIRFKESNFHDFYGKAYLVDINLDSLGLTTDTFYQLVLEMDAYNYEDLKIAFGYECRYKNGKVRVFSSYDFLNTKNLLPILPIKFYTPQLKAGGSLVLKPNSFLNTRIDSDKDFSNLLIEFWAQLGNYNKPFFNLINKQQNDTLLTLFKNTNRLLSFNEKEGEEYYKDCFIGKNAWNHYTVTVSNLSKIVTVYINDEKRFSFPINNRVNLKNLIAQFENRSRNRNYEIDMLKIWDFNNDVEISFQNKHYSSYSAENTQNFLSLDFDDDETIANIPSNSYKKIEYNNISFSHSNAPLFSKAPELNVVVYGGFYSIEWKQREISAAKDFILEKSVSGNDFKQIYSTYADDDLSKVYYFSDSKEPKDEIVYYRLKQINKGGSNIYSSTVKIGQVEQLKFSLEQNYPNPFNPETQITIEMIEQEDVEIYIYDLVGKKIEKLHDGPLSQGRHSFTFNGSNLPSGIYFFEAKTANSSVVRKMILAK